MKKLFWLVLLVTVGVYGTGALSLGESGAMKYLNTWEELSLSGDAAGTCNLLHEDLEFSIDDRSTPGQPLNLHGGKTELCDYFSKVLPAMKHVVTGMNVTRDQIEVKRDWLHPWTAHVSYTEKRSVSLAGVPMQIRTTGEDRLVLVRTLTDGIKIKALHAKTRMTTAS